MQKRFGKTVFFTTVFSLFLVKLFEIFIMEMYGNIYLNISNIKPMIIFTAIFSLFISGISALFISRVFSILFTKPIKKITKFTNNSLNSNLNVDNDISYSELEKLYIELQKKFESLSEIRKCQSDEINKMNAIVSNFVDGVIAIDISWNIIFANSIAEDIFNITDIGYQKRHILEVVKNCKLKEIISRVLTTGLSCFEEIALIPKERILRVYINSVKNTDDDIVGAVIIVRDITKIKKLEKMRTDFIANVSHELKTPLTSIKGFIETLLDGAYKNPSLAKRFLNIIDVETSRLNRLISDLLDLSQLETNRIKLNIIAVDIKIMLDEVEMIFHNRFEKKKIKFFKLIPEDLSKVKVDTDCLRQVFINLLDNAVKYTPTGGEIWVIAEDRGRKIKVSVCDNGVGIPEDDLKRIFERFYRVDKARARKLGGTGLGLSIVKHIVKAMDGEIWAESKHNEGSKFVFTLPKENNNS